MDRHHWGMVTSESEALQVLNKGSAGEFMETACNPCDPVSGERFLGRFVLEKNSLMTDILRSTVSLRKVQI